MGSGVASFECKLDMGMFVACTSPQNYMGLSVGSHTFMVRAIDNVGNPDATSGEFHVDDQCAFLRASHGNGNGWNHGTNGLSDS